MAAAIGGGALVAGAVATAPAWLAVGAVVVVGGAAGDLGSKVGGWIGGAIGRIWDSPGAEAPVIDIPLPPEPIGPTTTVTYEAMPAATPAPAPAAVPAAPSSLMRMREDRRPARQPIKPELSITKGL